MRVTICGPNLPAQLAAEGDMHAHSADCGDLRRYPFDRFGERGWTITAESLRGVVEDVYGDQMHDYDPPAPWTDYESEVKVFPCVRLPREVENDG